MEFVSRDNMLVGFVATAADPYEDKWFVEEDRKALEKAGFRLRDISLKGKTREQLSKELEGVGIIFVAGGNTFYLLEKARESGFDRVVKELVSRGVVYAGSSAGSIIAGPSIEPVKYIDEPSLASLKSFRGFGLVDFVVLPHFGRDKYKKQYEAVMKEFSGSGHKLVPLNDGQAVIVKDRGYKIVGQ